MVTPEQVIVKETNVAQNSPKEAVEQHTESISEVEAEAKKYIYFKESTNRTDAVNKSSGACGIGQALPCSKLSNDCPNWKTDYACQDEWFSNYMLKRYNSWTNAKKFWETNHWW